MITLVPGGSIHSLARSIQRAWEFSRASGKPAYVYQSPDFEWDWGYFIPAGDYFLEVSPDEKIGIGDEDHIPLKSSAVSALAHSLEKAKGRTKKGQD